MRELPSVVHPEGQQPRRLLLLRGIGGPGIRAIGNSTGGGVWGKSWSPVPVNRSQSLQRPTKMGPIRKEDPEIRSPVDYGDG